MSAGTLIEMPSDDALADGAEAAAPFSRGVMRMPCSSIWMLMSTPSLPLAARGRPVGGETGDVGAGGAGAAGGAGITIVGRRGDTTMGESSIVSVTLQRNGGSSCRIDVVISSSTA